MNSYSKNARDAFGCKMESGFDGGLGSIGFDPACCKGPKEDGEGFNLEVVGSGGPSLGVYEEG